MFDLLAAAATAAAAALGIVTADVLVTGATGRHIHEHVFGWWCDLRDALRGWAQAHPDLVVARYVGRVTQVLDDAAVSAMNTVTFRVRAIDAAGVKHEVETLRLSPEELAEQFPQLRHKKKVTLDLSL